VLGTWVVPCNSKRESSWSSVLKMESGPLRDDNEINWHMCGCSDPISSSREMVRTVHLILARAAVREV
jgi:hypothetical protein